MSCYRLTAKKDKNMTKQARKCYRYSICFKQKIVEEIKQGERLQAVSRKYGIR
jgi:transposase-like protein